MPQDIKEEKSQEQPEEKHKEETKSNARISTGIPHFDELVDGGLEPGTVTLLAGRAGSGKTIFSIQYLVNGVTKYDEPGLYITFEQKKKSLYKNMSSVGIDLEKLEEQGKFFILEYKPEQVKKLIMEGGGIVETIISKHNIKRIVVDSITSFSLLYTTELEKKAAALALFEILNNWGCTALLTSQTRPDPKKGDLDATFDFEVDGVVELYYNKKEGLRSRSIEIIKMRGTHTPNKTMEFVITDKGVEIHPDKIVSS